MKKKPANDDSDEFDADEPEEFDESGEDWEPEEENNSKGKKRGRAAAKATPKKGAAKKKKVEKKEPSEDEEEEDEEGEEDEEDEGEDSEDSESDAVGNGSFVVLKEDLKNGTNLPLWKIDGKALLQKFLPFEQDGKQLYKSTSTYSGWTQNNRDQYAAAPVTFVVQSKKETIVEFLRDQVNLDEKLDKDDKAKA